MATMGPPPSPKEPRRSGRRAAPSASTSKSPAGSPASDAPPKPKESSHRHSHSTSSNPSRNKRTKHEENEDTPDEPHKNGINGNGNARARRKGKDKEKTALVVEITNGDELIPVDVAGDDGTEKVEEEEEEAGITRCICAINVEDETDTGEFMAMCEECKTWQHGQCMGFVDLKDLPQHYYCEQCRPDMYVDLLKKLAKRTRQSSATSHHTATAAGNTSRSSRSHSPTHNMKPTKRRNTMNSRDAAYEESFQALIEATAAEAAAAHETTNGQSTNGLQEGLNGHADEHETEAVPNTKRKRKRSDGDAPTTKRTRSASTTSELPTVPNLARDATPMNGNNVKSASVLPSTTKTTTRNRRTAARKSQAHDLMSVDGDDAGSTASARRPGANSRSKANTAQDHGTRRAQGNASKDHATASTSHASNSATSRAYHQSHAYAVSQQPLFTSWNLPDYLAHLEPMLPTGVPRPLEVRGSGVDSSGRESLERMTERGVKVKWPSKRMSVGDMNKRVRALVEWVGREQASALERSRRREALEKALKDGQELTPDGAARESGSHADVGHGTVVDGELAKSPLQEKRPPLSDGVSSAGDSGPITMKMMEELMEELISFQERFGPGAKSKERERRTVTL
ncbi:hypothetical protein B0H21DRAFT_689181 [Amylocystis lapponica]|nr:hypothetical protein B0H21DRAFT_689181 [Amylocystis lapponica]